MSERSLPPVGTLAVVSMGLIIVGGIYLAAHIPSPVSLGVPIALLAVSGAIVVYNVIALSRVREFAWTTFFRVAGWAAVAYVISAGMIGYVFVLDGVRGGTLVVLLASLLVYAVNVPLILGFGVARYQPVGE
jgi:hypothetical protein